MSGFQRNVTQALERRHDLIVVGGGIYGIMLTLEAARRGLKPLLAERDDFGSAASLNSLRILHGGLRYLQSMDLPRFFESVEQRDWFMRHFPTVCRVLPCMMPLYGRGLMRPGVFRPALAINDLLSRNRGLGKKGKVLGVRETEQRFPNVAKSGLKGSALWYDGQILSPQRLHVELLRWAADHGASMINYAEAIGLERNGSKATGLVTSVGTFAAPVIINAAGSWSREVAERLDRDRPELMVPSLTFNVLLNVTPPSESAVAVQGKRMYFITPHRSGMTFAGTVHRKWEGIREPTDDMINEFVSDLGNAVPDWPVSPQNVVRVTAGVLPARAPGAAEMAHRSTLVTHEISGLYSACGIKYTTAQRFARSTLDRIFGKMRVDPAGPNLGNRAIFVEPDELMKLSDPELEVLAKEEAVTCKEDFLERRMDWILEKSKYDQFGSRIDHILKNGSTKQLNGDSQHA